MSTTSGVPVEEHRAHWESWNFEHLTPLDVFIPSRSGLEVQSYQRDIAGIKLTYLTGSKHVVQHTWDHIQQHPQPSLFATIILDGRGFFFSEALSTDFHTHDVLLYSLQDPYMLAFENDMSQVVVEISHDSTPEYYKTLKQRAPVRITSSSAIVATLEDLPRTVARSNPGAASAELQEIMGFLYSALGLNKTHHAYGFLYALLSEHYRDPNFNIARLARLSGFSSRQLHRIFAFRGTTPSDTLRNLRSAYAVDQLEHTMLPVEQIAMGSGFASRQALFRAMAKDYGATPSAIRKGV